MNTTISPNITERPDLASAVGHANELLRAELGISEPVVTTAWSMLHDSRNRPLLELVIADPSASVSMQFAPNELARNGDRLQGRLRRLWDDLLQIRSVKQMQRINQLVKELEGE